MRKIIFTCFAVLIFTAGGFAETKHYFVSRVIDGDTVKLADGSKVRYIGIDTPETRRRVWGGWMWAPEPYAKKAKEYNEELVFGKKVRLEFDKEKRDKYRRLLAYVYTPEGKMVNEEILNQIEYWID